MTRSVFFGVLVGLLAMALLAGMGLVAYQAGFAQGMAANGAESLAPVYAQPGLVGPALVLYRPMPWAFGFGWLGCLAPFVIGLLFLGLIRMAFGFGRHGGWGHGWYGRGKGDMPPFVHEWHRRAHGLDPEAKGPSDAPA